MSTDYPTVIPMIAYENGVAALEWLAKTFGFRERARQIGADVYGYSDQAHLIREFKSFADCTPRDFAASAPAYFELRQNEDWCDFMKQYFNLSYAG